MTRLAIVAPHFPEYTLRYASSMTPFFEVLVCVDAGQLAQEYEDRAIDLPKEITLKQLRFKTFFEFLELYRALRRFKPTLLHFQEAVGPRRAMFNAVLARLLRSSTAVIVTVHDPTAHAGRDVRAAQRTAGITKYVRNLSDKIVVHGRFCADQMAELMPSASSRLIVSEHGLILEPDLMLSPPEPSFPLRLYFFGRMETYKGVEILLKAVELLHEKHFPFALSIAGRGPELDRLEQRFKLLPSVSVFNGFVPPNQIMKDIQSAECVVLPYLSATQSGVLAAAYAGHRYVIASSIGGLSDVVTHRQNGLLLPAGDPEALADAIQLLGNDTHLRTSLLRGARATAEGQLNWSKIAQALSTEFSSLRNIPLKRE